MAKKHKKANFTPTSSQIAWGMLYLLFQFFLLPELLRLLSGYLPKPLNDAQLNLVYYGVNFLAAVVIYRRYLANHLSALGKNWWGCLKALILGYVFYWVSSFALSWTLGRLIPGFANLNDSAIAAMAGSDFWAVALGTVILVPLAEECTFRGLVFGSLYDRSHTAAYLVSTLAFSAIHVLGYLNAAGPWVLLGCFLQYIPAGLCLAWSFQESGSVFVPVIIHTLVNALAILSLR